MQFFPVNDTHVGVPRGDAGVRLRVPGRDCSQLPVCARAAFDAIGGGVLYGAGRLPRHNKIKLSG
jgi:hypothetical protein